MGTYELDDVLVREWLESDAGVADLAMAMALKDQVPIPVPQHIGAVVATDAPAVGRVVYIRWAKDSRTHSPWIAANDHEQPYRTEDIGRITEVLSLGVEL
jgi:hypothetical protein